MPYTIVSSELQTDQLVRSVRSWVGDIVSELYEDDFLAQKLYDVFEIPFKARTGLSTELTDPTSDTDPLETDDELTANQKAIWVLYAALSVLTPETLEAARVSGTIRSAAGSITLTEIYKHMRAQLDMVEGILSSLLLDETGVGMLAFVNLSSLGGRTDPAS